jgi:hypothetical protein
VAINTVVVFGDSLSDIGKKWVTKAGYMARKTGQMKVSPSGRFSDCRNWTDFMYEQATGRTLITDTANSTIKLSNRHTTLNSNSLLQGVTFEDFQYANYAEGGACGDTPANLRAFLGTFEDQIKAFISDCKNNKITLGNTLFIIWFGANDLYTAGRDPAGMATVAEKIASIHRDTLNDFVTQWNNAMRLEKRRREEAVGIFELENIRARGEKESNFIFVNLARPLSSVRYTLQLKKAEQSLLSAAKPMSFEMASMNPFKSNMWLAESTMRSVEIDNPDNKKIKEYIQLKNVVSHIKSLEQGVLNFNLALALHTRKKGDGLVEIGSCMSEETISKLVAGNYGLRTGADTQEALHVSSADYSTNNLTAPMTTIDEVHPTDHVYRLIWLEIYEEIKKCGCSFGSLSNARGAPTLSNLSGPGAQERVNFARVLQQIPGARANLKPP